MGQQRIRQLQKKAATPTAAPPAQKPFSWQRPFPVPEQNTATSAPQPIPDLQARLEILRRANPDWSKVKASSNPAKAVQAKLTVGAPNDQYEQEADRVADQVMGMPDGATQPSVQREGKHEEDELQAKPLAATITPLVQREEILEEEDPVQKKTSGNADIQREEMPEEEEVLTKPLSSGTLQRNEMAAEEDDLQMKSLGIADLQREEMSEEHEELQMKSLGTADLQRTARPEDEESLQPKSFPTPQAPHPTPSLESQLSNTQGSGSPLSNDVRAFMEPRFSADFSQVRVHTGSDAVQMNRDLNAQAFTHKQDVYFGAGKAPGKNALTAHELTHVVQQTGKTQAQLIQRQSTAGARKGKSFTLTPHFGAEGGEVIGGGTFAFGLSENWEGGREGEITFGGAGLTAGTPFSVTGPGSSTTFNTHTSMCLEDFHGPGRVGAIGAQLGSGPSYSWLAFPRGVKVSGFGLVSGFGAGASIYKGMWLLSGTNDISNDPSLA